MAFPQIGATVQSVSGSLATSHTVALPSGITAGMLLIVDINWGVNVGSPGWPIGWTQFYDHARSSYRKAGAWRIADGSEGASITVTSNGINTRGIYLAARITDFDPATAPVATIADANTANPDCPNSAPGWGILDILWLAIYGWNDTTATNTVYPANYGLHQSSGLQGGTGGCGRGFAGRELNASSENPGAATISNGEDWVGVTVAIKPAVIITPISIAGDQPSATGALTSVRNIPLAGNQPAASGALIVNASIRLTGNQPAATGVLRLAAQIRLSGNQPAPSGSLAFIIQDLVSLSGNQPAPSGALSIVLVVLISLSGNQPAPSGTIVSEFVIFVGSAQKTWKSAWEDAWV